MSYQEAITKLKGPFRDKYLDWRIQSSGFTNQGKPWAMILCYVDARAVQERLDQAVGPQNWKDEYEHLPNGVKCRLSLRFEDGGEWVAKENGAAETQVEGFKGGFSKAFVRTAVNWGVGRYLYNVPVTWAKFVDDRTGKSKPGKYKKELIKDKNKNKQGYHYWEIPQLEGTAFGWQPPNKAPGAQN